MPTTSQEASTLTLDAFWSWLKRHPNCLVQASTDGAHLYDAEDLHWTLMEEPDHLLVVQLMRAKSVLGEILVDARQVLFVQSMPDEQDTQSERFFFEVIGGKREDSRPLVTFLLAHAYDEQGHVGLVKH